MTRLWSTVLTGLLVVVLLALLLTHSRAAEPAPADRAAFFKRMEWATLAGRDEAGKRRRRNCCGEGDWTLGKIVGPAPGGVLYEVTDPRRHPSAKPGDRVTVPRELFVIDGASPWGQDGAFLKTDGTLAPLCGVWPDGG